MLALTACLTIAAPPLPAGALPIVGIKVLRKNYAFTDICCGGGTLWSKVPIDFGSNVTTPAASAATAAGQRKAPKVRASVAICVQRAANGKPVRDVHLARAKGDCLPGYSVTKGHVGPSDDRKVYLRIKRGA